MLLRWVSSLNQAMQFIILGDNEQVIRTANTQSYVMASRSSHGTWVKAYSSLQAEMPRYVSTCGTSASTGGMNLKILDTAIAGSGYRNPASRPLKSCGT